MDIPVKVSSKQSTLRNLLNLRKRTMGQIDTLATIKTTFMNLEENKKNAIAFYRTAYEGNPKIAIDKYIGNTYIQHNPDVADGTQGFIDYFERMQLEYPDKSIEFVRCIAEGDLVGLHTHQTWPGNDEYVTMDFFRFDEHGKICEHWDSIQQIPKESANPNKMY